MPCYYVQSGELKVKVEAANPMEGAVKALKLHTANAQLDHQFYIDERGWRKVSAAYTLRFDNVMHAAGYEIEDDEDEGYV